MTANETPPEDLLNALRSLEAARDAPSSKLAYDAFLYAVGNNHAGTYGPVVLVAISAVAPLLSEAGPWACRAILDAFIDLRDSFVPEEHAERLDGKCLEQLVADRIASLRPDIEAIALRSDAASPSARELLRAMMNR